MNLLKTIGKKLPSFAIPALNWYKIGAMVVVLAAWTVFIDQRATHRCELKQEKQKTEQVAKQLDKVVEHVEERVPVVNEKEKASTELKAAVAKTKKINERYIYENQNRNAASCDLSDAEFNGVQELIKQSREAAD